MYIWVCFYGELFQWQFNFLYCCFDFLHLLIILSSQWFLLVEPEKLKKFFLDQVIDVCWRGEYAGFSYHILLFWCLWHGEGGGFLDCTFCKTWTPPYSSPCLFWDLWMRKESLTPVRAKRSCVSGRHISESCWGTTRVTITLRKDSSIIPLTLTWRQSEPKCRSSTSLHMSPICL